MKESHYNVYMKTIETLDTTMGHHCAAASITTSRLILVNVCKCIFVLYILGPQFSKSAPEPRLKKQKEQYAFIILVIKY